MATAVGVLGIAAGYGLAILTGSVLRRRLGWAAATALLVVAGVLLGLGATALQDGPPTWAWVATPLLMAVCVTVHVSALTTGDGPLRT